MQTDIQIQQDVMNELRLDARVMSGDISVSVKGGIVTLRGKVPIFFEKSAAANVVWRVPGVRAVADEIEVKAIGAGEKSDEDIARAVLTALEYNSPVSRNLRVTVEKGWITLDGQTDWDTEKYAAKTAVAAVHGVQGITSNISAKQKDRRSAVRNRPSAAVKPPTEYDFGEYGFPPPPDAYPLSRS